MLCLDSRKGVIDFSAKNGEKDITILSLKDLGR